MAGYVFYEGPSEIDGKPVVGIATTRSANTKTGPLLQTWILLRDVNPVEAVYSGQDSSICGACPLRGVMQDGTTRNRLCYVQVHQAPRTVWGAYHRGVYTALSDSCKNQLRAYSVRVGSYGDPAAIPIQYWEKLWSLCADHVRPGYTHQWRDPRFLHWSRHLMASVENEADAQEARSLGWRTFRVVSAVDQISLEEILCPASPEAGNTHTCATCGACNGRKNSGDLRRSVAIVGHGPPNRRKSLLAFLSALN